MNNRKNAYTQVYNILSYLNEEEYNKIPPEVIEAIKLNRNEEYIYEIDEDVELKDQEMLPQTKAILFNLFKDYLATTEQKEKIIAMIKEEKAKKELEKEEKYGVDLFKKDSEEKSFNESVSNLELVEHKENTFKSLLNKIKSFFTK